MTEEVVNQEDVSSSNTMNPALFQQKVEERARQQGWKPLEEFEGDIADWIDAKEFVARKPLYTKIHDLTTQISKQRQKFDQDMSIISQQFAEMSEVAYKKALAELKADRALAVKDADLEAVEALDEQIVDIEKQRATSKKITPTSQSPSETPEMIAWKEKNASWFEKDKEMTEDAVALGVGYLAQHQGRKTQAEMLEFVESRIRKVYPEKFGGKVKKEDPTVEVDGGQSRPSSGSRKGKLSVSDLTEQERDVMKTLIKRGALKHIAAKNKRTEQEEYLAQLADAKAR